MQTEFEVAIATRSETLYRYTPELAEAVEMVQTARGVDSQVTVRVRVAEKWVSLGSSLVPAGQTADFIRLVEGGR